jgi:two-component system, chemotaxis family, protein-glutamate methylesterase/glutaminase
MTKNWRHDIVVIGGSAGALDVIDRLLELLPGGLPATLFVTLHIPAEFPSLVARRLEKHHAWCVREAVNYEHFHPGDVLVAPPDRHLLVEQSRVVLGAGPRENRHRPAIDTMFRSAARTYGSRVAAIVFSGQLDDGAAGLMAVKMRNGVAIVQDPAEAAVPDMPNNAITYAGPDHVLTIKGIASLLNSLCSGDLPLPDRSVETSMLDSFDHEKEIIPPKTEADEAAGRPSPFACPECHGVLWEVHEGKSARFRCRVGHAYSADSLRVALSEAAENALWVAMRALEEKAALLRRMANRTSLNIAAQYREEAQGFDQHATTIRRMLANSHSPTAEAQATQSR